MSRGCHADGVPRRVGYGAVVSSLTITKGRGARDCAPCVARQRRVVAAASSQRRAGSGERERDEDATLASSSRWPVPAARFMLSSLMTLHSISSKSCSQISLAKEPPSQGKPKKRSAAAVLTGEAALVVHLHSVVSPVGAILQRSPFVSSFLRSETGHSRPGRETT